jgi:hypothetical protein
MFVTNWDHFAKVIATFGIVFWTGDSSASRHISGKDETSRNNKGLYDSIALFAFSWNQRLQLLLLILSKQRTNFVIYNPSLAGNYPAQVIGEVITSDIKADLFRGLPCAYYLSVT